MVQNSFPVVVFFSNKIRSSMKKNYYSVSNQVKVPDICLLYRSFFPNGAF
jgi:hypothetical protein